MVAQPIADDRRRCRDEIESLIELVAEHPFDVALHRRLREAAFQHKAAGGPPLGLFERLRRRQKGPLQRLLHAERLWSFNPVSLEHLDRVLRAVDLLASERPSDADPEPLRNWLKRIERALRPTA